MSQDTKKSETHQAWNDEYTSCLYSLDLIGLYNEKQGLLPLDLTPWTQGKYAKPNDPVIQAVQKVYAIIQGVYDKDVGHNTPERNKELS